MSYKVERGEKFTFLQAFEAANGPLGDYFGQVLEIYTRTATEIMTGTDEIK